MRKKKHIGTKNAEKKCEEYLQVLRCCEDFHVKG